MRYLWKKLSTAALLALCLAFIEPLPSAQAASRLQDTGDRLVIVIDPGHGANDNGTTENGHVEKDMDFITAQAMYDELKLYEGVEVYLTRTRDQNPTLKQRAQYAASVDADFLFSIHYNASECHEFFGAEVWVSMFPPYNAYGYQAGCEILSGIKEKGLFLRGVKTRKGEHGDYYGIIRESVAREVPALIIEHCHVDEPRDAEFCSEEEQLIAFGKSDAAAVARYFGLKSSVLNVDYSDYKLTEAEGDTIVPYTVQDGTEPDICQVDFVSADIDKGLLTLSVSAADYESTLIYYTYSLDGGETFSQRELWPESDTLHGSYPDTFQLNLEIPLEPAPQIILRAYNMYDLYRESEPFDSTQSLQNALAEKNAGMEEQTPAPDVAAQYNMPPIEDTALIIPVTAQAGEEAAGPGLQLIDLLMVGLTAVILLFVLVIILQTAAYRRNRARRNQLRNDAGDNMNQPK